MFYCKEFIIRNISRKKPKQEHLVNKDIPFQKLFVLDFDGTKLGIMSKRDALSRSEDKGLDLVVISDNPKQPVAKILDYGKFKYKRKKKRKEAKANQSITNNREVRLTPMIGKHDLDTKVRKARQFLMAGDRLKVSLKFRGRELARKELGYNKLKEFYELLDDIASIQKAPTLNGGRFLDMYLQYDKNKKNHREVKDAKDKN